MPRKKGGYAKEKTVDSGQYGSQMRRKSERRRRTPYGGMSAGR